MSFQAFGLSPALLSALQEQGFEKPTAIQQQAIPHILQGHDVLAGSQTGTGKTAAFGLPLLELIIRMGLSQTSKRVPRGLILTPTRELAIQIHDCLRSFSTYHPISSAVIYGGVGIGRQTQTLNQGVDLLIACPGRLIDHIDRKSVNLTGVEVLVLDEADRMLDMGFLPSIRRILKEIPPDRRQTLLFSATFDQAIKKIALELLRSPHIIMITPQTVVAETISHTVHPVNKDKKRELLVSLIRNDQLSQVLVFTKTKFASDKLAKFLEKSGIPSAAIHGNKNQTQRVRALKFFKEKKIHVLVATDIAARGIDIDSLPKVINYELPPNAEDYVHRIGRTGRNGAVGEAISLVSSDEIGLLERISRLIGQQLVITPITGFEPSFAINLSRSSKPARNTKASDRLRSRPGPRSGHRTVDANRRYVQRTKTR